MILRRRHQLAAVVVVLSACFFAAGAMQPAGTAAAPGLAAAAARKAAVSPAAASWTFWGCWTQFSSGTCRDIYRDAEGNYWICRACGTTGTPSTSKCSRISSQTLATGYWCS